VREVNVIFALLVRIQKKEMNIALNVLMEHIPTKYGVNVKNVQLEAILILIRKVVIIAQVIITRILALIHVPFVH
jgi:hypothetical protein